MSDYKGKQPVLNRGVYDAIKNNHPSSTGLVGSDRLAAKDETSFLKQISAIDGDDDRTCMDVAVSLGNGTGVDKDNPMPIYITEDPGNGICSYDKATGVAAEGGTSNHDYVVTTAFEFRKFEASASSPGLGKFTLQIALAATPTVFADVEVLFNSVSQPNVKFDMEKCEPFQPDDVIRIVKENCEEDATDMYSTIKGTEVAV